MSVELKDFDAKTKCVFVSVDIQQGNPPVKLRNAELPELWRTMGFSADDVNAANEFAWTTAYPNAVTVAAACGAAGIPRIFIHWGFHFRDGMDLDPEIRDSMLAEHGDDFKKWSGYIGDPGSRPLIRFNIRPRDYVIAKTGQDAFLSSTLDFVLRNLKIERIIFVGGHTEACFGKTARSAKARGYQTLCVEDATFNARESTRMKGIEESDFDVVVSAFDLLSVL